jgi:hypothetical protein
MHRILQGYGCLRSPVSQRVPGWIVRRCLVCQVLRCAYSRYLGQPTLERIPSIVPCLGQSVVCKGFGQLLAHELRRYGFLDEIYLHYHSRCHWLQNECPLRHLDLVQWYHPAASSPVPGRVQSVEPSFSFYSASENLLAQ